MPTRVKIAGFFFEQYRAWRGQNPSSDELMSIAAVERNAHALETINDEITVLVKVYRKMEQCVK